MCSHNGCRDPAAVMREKTMRCFTGPAVVLRKLRAYEFQVIARRSEPLFPAIHHCIGTVIGAGWQIDMCIDRPQQAPTHMTETRGDHACELINSSATVKPMMMMMMIRALNHSDGNHMTWRVWEGASAGRAPPHPRGMGCSTPPPPRLAYIK